MWTHAYAVPGPLRHATAKPWLLAIARNELRNSVRSRRRLAQFLLRQPAPLHHPDHSEAVAPSTEIDVRAFGKDGKQVWFTTFG